MATISENIQRINKAKSDIKNAIIAKGGSVADNDKIDTYATAIEALPSGGGGAELPQNLSRFVTDDWGNPKKITIKGSVTTIPNDALKNAQIEEVIIGNGVTTIGDSAFRDCSALTAITIPDSVTTINGGAFASTEITNIVIPDSVTSIGGEAFYHCLSLTGITLSNNITTISYRLFRECHSLTGITIPNSVTTIGGEAFESCDNLSSVTIPDSVTTIGDYVFYMCRNLTNVTIGNGVTSIGRSAFYSFENYTVTINATTPPTLDGGAIGGSVTTIYVPSDSVDAYKSASEWSNYASKIQPIQG